MIRACLQCGTSFPYKTCGRRKDGSQRIKVYCSRECFRLAKRLEAGTRFGNLIALGFSHYDPDSHDAWYLFVCDCGNQKAIKGSSVTGGAVVSCGCVWKNHIRTHAIRHDMYRSPEYQAYQNARMRVQDEKPSIWKNYGGRGIEFRFTSFEQWFKELGPKPSPKHSVDRIDNDGHYEPGNIRWATRREQNLNKSNCGKCRALEANIVKLSEENERLRNLLREREKLA